MDPENQTAGHQASFQRLVDVFIRLGLLALLASWCYLIVKPFLLPVLWGLILAVAFHPLFHKTERLLGGRRKLTATLFGLLGVAFLVVPSYFFLASLVDSSTNLVEQLSTGTLEIPPPAESVQSWPLIGERLHADWLSASNNLEEALRRFAPQIRDVATGAAGILAGLGTDLLMFLIATILAAAFLATSSSGAKVFRSIFTRLVGERGEELAKLTTDTIRNVAKGVVGVALIQTSLAAVGLLVAGVPGAEIWILLILILAVIQLPTLLVLLPIVIYQFSVSETLPAVLFMIWSIIAGGSDSLLKPLLLGRGMKTPMLVILMGALGGMMWAGMLGLFLGAIMLSLGYELFLAWLRAAPPPTENTPPPETSH